MTEPSLPTNSGHRARLRQRLFDGGGKALMDHELVEYLLTLAIPRRDTKDQAKALIARFGGVGPLLAADADTLRHEGLTDGVIGALKIAEATALRLLETKVEGRPVLSSWDALGDYLQAAMGQFAGGGSADPVPQHEETGCAYISWEIAVVLGGGTYDTRVSLHQVQQQGPRARHFS